jgi:acyl-CoA reductase-like NAD-dependent aldehyde dehydrogenase
LKWPGVTGMRGKLLSKLADLIEANTEEFAALEALNGGEYESLFVRHDEVMVQ